MERKLTTMTIRKEVIDTQSLPVKNVTRKATSPKTVQRKAKEKTRTQREVMKTRNKHTSLPYSTQGWQASSEEIK